MQQLGAHVSTAGGLWTAFENAARLGATTIQIFGASPRQWKTAPLSDDEVNKFKRAWEQSAVVSVYLHASYLANPATPDPVMWKKTVANLTAHCAIGEQLGADGLIFHVGSAGKSTAKEGIENVARALEEILAAVPGSMRILIENGSSGGNKVGATAEEVGTIVRRLKSPRVGVCFDTAHAFEAGIITLYDEQSVRSLLVEWDTHVGLSNIHVIHCNDSKSPAGSHYDRHENLGAGYIGLDGLRVFAQRSELQNKAWILEVPGFDGNGPDVRNMDILRSFFSSV